IIGNGFDLYHGLPSSYYYFGCYLVDHYEDFYVVMGNMYNFKTYSYRMHEEPEPAIQYNLFWSDFEVNLGHLDSSWLECSLIDNLDLEWNEDAVELEVEGTENAKIVKDYFVEWVCKTLDTPIGFDIVEKSICENKLSLPGNSYFINFNYTSSLERLYKISEEDIFYIHGKANDDNPSLVVGHDNNQGINDLEKQIEEKESDLYSSYNQAMLNRINELKAEKKILENLYKPTSSIISDIEIKLNGKHFEEIYVYGLSCGSVDIPYIKCLKSMFPEAKWHFSYYDEKEKEARKSLVDQVIEPDNATYFEFKNDNAAIIEQEIIQTLGIKTYTRI
ncbi:MAG: AbiH family protein, partial [Oscillospiraceae bacterium]|nr:AbiH family protein [Oscillospiraceae bacterium]